MIGYSRAFKELYGPKPIEVKSKMNDRIRELAEQTKPLNENGQKVRGLNSEYHDQWMEKFAELIVRECATLAYDGPDGILEHFGVKK